MVDIKERYRLYNVLITGIRFFNIDGNIYYISYPSLYDIAYSEMLYKETYDKYKYMGWYTQQQYETTLIKQGRLDPQFKQKISDINNTIDNFKINLYKCDNPIQEKQIRKNIEIMRKNYNKLIEPLKIIQGKTVEGVAEFIVSNYLLKKSIYNIQNEPINDIPAVLLSKIMTRVHDAVLDNNTLRMLARTDPWRTYWSISKPNPFDIHYSLWSDERKSIVIYSRMYDSIYDSPECPNDSIVQDDDKLDGWLLDQKRKRKEKKNEAKQQSKLSNMPNAQEVFIVGKTREDFKEIEKLNDIHTQRIKRNRANQIKAKGSIRDVDLNDVQQSLRMQQTKAAVDSVKGRRK